MFLPACQWWGVWSLSHARPVIHNLEADSAAKKIVRPVFSLERDSKQVSRRCFIGSLFALSCSNIIRVLWRFIWAVFYCFRMPLRSLSSDTWGMLKAHSDMDRCWRCPLFNLSVCGFFLGTIPPNWPREDEMPPSLHLPTGEFQPPSFSKDTCKKVSCIVAVFCSSCLF